MYEADCPPRCSRFVDSEGTPLLVRPYSEGEYGALVAFYDSYPARHRSLSLPPASRRRIEGWLGRLLDSGRHLLAWHGDGLVGHVGYAPRDAAAPELLESVEASYHDRGIGTERCRQAVACAADGGCEALRVWVGRGNRRAIRIYERLGFRRIEQRGDTVEMRLATDPRLARRVQAPPAARS